MRSIEHVLEDEPQPISITIVKLTSTTEPRITAGSYTNLADNVFVVFRNKRREEELEKKAAGQRYKEAEVDKPSTRLKVCKNRHGGVEPMFGFYFHQESRQFTGTEDEAIHINLNN